MAEPNNVSASLAASLDQVRHSWGWFVALGVALVVLGIVCITGEVATTLISVIVLGWLLLLSGVMALVHAFRTRTWTGFFLYLLSAVLRVFVGYTLVRYPLIGALSLTLILAALFIVGGVFRAIGAASLRFPRWGWTAASGLIAVLLGLDAARAAAGLEPVVPGARRGDRPPVRGHRPDCARKRVAGALRQRRGRHRVTRSRMAPAPARHSQAAH